MIIMILRIVVTIPLSWVLKAPSPTLLETQAVSNFPSHSSAPLDRGGCRSGTWERAGCRTTDVHTEKRGVATTRFGGPRVGSRQQTQAPAGGSRTTPAVECNVVQAKGLGNGSRVHNVPDGGVDLAPHVETHRGLPHKWFADTVPDMTASGCSTSRPRGRWTTCVRRRRSAILPTSSPCLTAPLPPYSCATRFLVLVSSHPCNLRPGPPTRIPTTRTSPVTVFLIPCFRGPYPFLCPWSSRPPCICLCPHIPHDRTSSELRNPHVVFLSRSHVHNRIPYSTYTPRGSCSIHIHSPSPVPNPYFRTPPVSPVPSLYSGPSPVSTPCTLSVSLHLHPDPMSVCYPTPECPEPVPFTRVLPVVTQRIKNGSGISESQHINTRVDVLPVAWVSWSRQTRSHSSWARGVSWGSSSSSTACTQ